jgi:hypothetical protein
MPKNRELVAITGNPLIYLDRKLSHLSHALGKGEKQQVKGKNEENFDRHVFGCCLV